MISFNWHGIGGSIEIDAILTTTVPYLGLSSASLVKQVVASKGFVLCVKLSDHDVIVPIDIFLTFQIAMPIPHFVLVRMLMLFFGFPIHLLYLYYTMCTYTRPQSRPSSIIRRISMTYFLRVLSFQFELLYFWFNLKIIINYTVGRWDHVLWRVVRFCSDDFFRRYFIAVSKLVTNRLWNCLF